MRWEDFRRSDNVEDRRGEAYGGDGGGSMLGGRGNLGIGAIIILGLIGWALGIDPRILIGGAEMLNGVRNRPQVSQPAPTQQRQAGPRPTKWGNSSPRFSPRMRTSGPISFPRKKESPTSSRNWCYIMALLAQAAAARRRPWGLFIAH